MPERLGTIAGWSLKIDESGYGEPSEQGVRQRSTFSPG